MILFRQTVLSTILLACFCIAFAFAAPGAALAKSEAAQKAGLSTVQGHKLPLRRVSADMPYERKRLSVLDAEMAYVDVGEGDPVLFVHGVPTSSYLWRNIIPHIEGQARAIAPDLIGFGASSKSSKTLIFEDHYRYLEAFIAAKKLDRITLVLHDWGSALGLHYARLNPKRIKAIVTMESIIAPTMPAVSYDMLRKGVANFFRYVRSPNGRQDVITDNVFIERILPQSVDRPIDDVALRQYRAPFDNPDSRRQIEAWPLQMPIEGVPAAMVDTVSTYNDWLGKTEKPWLLLYATPGGLNPQAVADYWAKRARNVETHYIGNGLHYVQEDQPFAIGRALSDWYRRLEEGPSPD